MLPIIRRTRRPLTEPEVATIIPAPEIRSDFGQFRSDSSVSLPADKTSDPRSPEAEPLVPALLPSAESVQSTINNQPPANYAPSMSINQPSTNPPASAQSTFAHSLSTGPPTSAPSTINHQLSTNPWCLQPGESPADYQAFATWLQLPSPRNFAKAAAALKCSVQRLRRIAGRYKWKSRADAFDNHRAAATSLALDQLLNEEASDFKRRADQFRHQEWLLHEEMLQAAFAVAQDLKKHPRRTSITELTRLFDLASTLGRRATGLPLDPVNETPPPRPNWDAEAALKKIYGDP